MLEILRPLRDTSVHQKVFYYGAEPSTAFKVEILKMQLCDLHQKCKDALDKSKHVPFSVSANRTLVRSTFTPRVRVTKLYFQNLDFKSRVRFSSIIKHLLVHR